MSYQNVFETCHVEIHSSGRDIFICENLMNGEQRHFIHNSLISMCKYHLCMVLDDLYDNITHNIMSCSGAIIRFDSDLYYFNPITPYGVNFSAMSELTTSTVDFFAGNLQYYYQSDVRTMFNETITSITCTDDFKTCVRTANFEMCFGNTLDKYVIHSMTSLFHGLIVSFAFALFVYYVLKKEIVNSMFFHFVFFVIPLVAIGLIYNGMFIAVVIPYIMGNLIAIFTWQLFSYYNSQIPPDLDLKKIKDSFKPVT